MELWREQAQFSHDLALLIQCIEKTGYYCTMGEAYRTTEQALFNARKGIGIVDSQHCKRLAVDINLFDKDGLFLEHSQSHEQFGKYWESLDKKNRWGGHFDRADGNHYERR